MARPPGSVARPQGTVITVKVKAYRTGYVTTVGISGPLGPVQAG